MFQVPILVLVLVVRRVVGTPASLGLSPVHVMSSTREDSSSTELASRVSVAVSVTVSFFFFFLIEWGCLPYPNPQPGGPVSALRLVSTP